MNALEDAFWSARAVELARIHGGIAAVLVRRGRAIAERYDERRGDPERVVLDGAGTRGRGGTLYVSRAPSPRASGLARQRGIARVVVPHLCAVDDASRAAWADAAIRIEHAPPTDGPREVAPEPRDTRARRAS